MSAPAPADLAVDIGGTTIAVGLVDEAGTLVHTAVRPTPRGDAETVWAQVAALIAETVRTAGGRVRAAGVVSAGPIERDAGTVSPINIAAWRSFPLRARVQAALPGVAVHLGGDGTAMALGESWRGAGQGVPSMLGMVVSTGVGGGLILDGAPYPGRTGNAGHVGHVVVDPAGAPCHCGGRGCVETVAAAPALVGWARSNGWTGSDAKALAAAAAAGDPVATAAFARGAAALAAMIASVAATCDLDLVVVGGGVSRAGAVLFDPLRAALAGHTGLAFLRGLRVVPAALGADAGLVGAAALTRPRGPRFG